MGVGNFISNCLTMAEAGQWPFPISQHRFKGYWLTVFGRSPKHIGLTQYSGMGIHQNRSISVSKALAEYIERTAFFQDDLQRENGYDTVGFAAYPKFPNAPLAKKLVWNNSYYEAIEKFVVMEFWNKLDVAYETIRDGKRTYILPVIANSPSFVCICIEKLDEKGVAVGFACQDTLPDALEKSKIEVLAHTIGSHNIRQGAGSDLLIYQKRMEFLMNHGQEAFQWRLSQKGHAKIKIPPIEVDRKIVHKQFKSHLIHHIRLQNQGHFLDPEKIEVGYV